MSVKEIRPENAPEGTAKDKKSRDIGSVGLEDLVAKVQQKIEQKAVAPVAAKTAEAPNSDTPELKKQYFNKVGVEKNMDTTAARAMRGNLSGAADASNLKLIVLPKMEKLADPGEVTTMGQKSNMAAPFKMDLGDLLGRTMTEIEQKPVKFQKRLSKLEERAKLREKKFGKRVPPNDEDPNEFADEEYNRKKKSKAVAKMFEYMNKALGQKMDLSGAPEGLLDDAKKAADDDDEDDGL